MRIIATNTRVLNISLQFSEDNTEITYQAITNLITEGNPYPDLYTEKIVQNLICPTSNVANIQAVTEAQVDEWVRINYPANF